MGAFPFGHPPWIHWKQKFWALCFSYIWLRFLLGHISPPNLFQKRLLSHSFRPTCVSWVKIEQTGFMFWFMDQICKFAFEKHLTHKSGKLNFAVWCLWLDETLCPVQILPGARPDPTWSTTGTLTNDKRTHTFRPSCPLPPPFWGLVLLPVVWIKETGVENCLTWNFLTIGR